VNYRLGPAVLVLGAMCLASTAGIGVMMYKLASVEAKLLEVDQLHLGERLLRLEAQLPLKDGAVPNPELRAVVAD
jgi:hypothetical protein